MEERACYYCATVAGDDALYCGQCGRTLKVERCAACGGLVAPENQFCGWCGVPVLEYQLPFPAIAEEQLRQVTVLFALVSGLREAIELTEPDAFRDLLEECFNTLTAEVQARGGVIDKYMADSLLALFGVPIAHEDDPIRAVGAALGMTQAMEQFNDKLKAQGLELKLKIGINTGKVLVGYVGNAAERVTVMGDVVNTASRVEHAAPPGAILICDSTRRALGEQFVIHPEPPLAVKGKAEPISVYRVYPNPDGTSLDVGLDLPHLPLIGREAAFDQLAMAWRQVVRPSDRGNGQSSIPGQWVTLLGDVGMGKERLIQEFDRYVASDPCRPAIHHARGLSFVAGSGSVVLRRLLASLAGVEAGADAATENAKILALAQLIAGPDPETGEPIRAETVARSLAWLAGIALPELPRDISATLSPTRIRAQGMRHLRLLLQRLAAQRPMLIIATELHRGHDAALDFLENLGNDPPPGLMLLTSGLPTLEARRPQWGQNNPSHIRIVLEPLTLQDTFGLVKAVAGQREIIPVRVIESLYQFTGGNPFYLTETLRDYLEKRRRLDASKGEPDFTVPDSIEGVLQSRIDRLAFHEAQTLRAAAVIGTTFWAEAVAKLLGGPRTEALDHLCRQGFIKERSPSSLPGHVEYAFDHALTAKVAAGNLLENVRKKYHLLAAEWLLGQSHALAPTELAVAHHFEGAGAIDRAIPHYARAADRALAAYDCHEAIRLAEHALHLLDNTPVELEPSLKAHLRAQRGEARRMLAEFEPALADFEAAARICQEIDDHIGGATARYRIGLVYLALGMHEQALKAAESGDKLLQGQTAPAVAAVGFHLRAELLMHRGEPVTARVALDRAIAIWRMSGDQWSLAHGLNTLGRLMTSSADFSAAQRAFKDSARLRESLGDSYGLAITLGNLAMIAERQGQFGEALGYFHRALLLHRRMGNRRGMANTLINQGVGYTRCGFYGRARVALEEALEIHRGLRKGWETAACQVNLGHLWLRLGLPDKATHYLEEAAKRFRASDDPESEAECLVDLGSAHLRAGEVDEAGMVGERAFALLGGRSGGDAEARVLQLLSATALARGDMEEARQYVEELEWNDAVQLTPELQMETALLAGRIALAENRSEVALTRFEEAERIAKSHDLIPGLWEAHSCRLEVFRTTGDHRERSARRMVEESFQELLARIEDVELVQLMQARAPRIAGDTL